MTCIIAMKSIGESLVLWITSGFIDYAVIKFSQYMWQQLFALNVK